MNYLSVCSGIEAATVAWHGLGWKAAGFSEIEPFPSAVLDFHYPDVTNFGDMTLYKDWILNDPIRLLVGGTPCQSFSVAGLRKGMDDPRGNLALVYLGIADHLRPQWIVWENVPGVLSSTGGRDFGSFLGALAELGYGFAYRVLDAQFFGVAQRRRRVFVVGYLGDWRPAAAVLFERQSLRRDTAPSREPRQETTGCPTAGIASGKPTIGTLMANAGTKLWLGDQEAFSGDYRIHHPSYAIQSTVIGRSDTAGPRGTGISEEVSFTLTKADQHGVATPVVGEGDRDRKSLIFFEPRSPDGSPRVYDVDGASPTLNTMSGGQRQPCVTHVAVDLYNGNETGDTTTTLTTRGGGNASGPSVMTPYGFNVNARPDEMKFEENLSGTLTNSQNVGMLYDMRVRRLTPVECERLQGFPDGYTNIPWRKKDESPDGPRYKALGNSMAVPVMRWIGERIQMVDDLLR